LSEKVEFDKKRNLLNKIIKPKKIFILSEKYVKFGSKNT